ncbi:ATP-binding cassette domain-containing protein [Phytohabitans sp. ZYX-F-186]|uniref:ATP-binding cassette domain-containing protein n=1 Tax=Phytohabitans maris TaxID=3071409 RepID=A0ABU0ZPR8_9ACTN|nr:ATP-binding cassette domain-containing protein [Phytohabitans sp. ZYX-F-186]MDQ7909026.1 ATP-binding cassette domain-containing protein [Phytohabitans sp. ZYX-F-186]
MTAPALRLRQISKRYGATTALDRVDLEVYPGEVLGLVGDNGAGKSTLLQVASGAHRPTAGELCVQGRPVAFGSPRAAAAAGIHMVYQDLALVPTQDVGTNLYLGDEPLRGGPLRYLGVLDKRRMRREADQALARLGVRLGPTSRPVELLSAGQRQVVALARAAVRVMAAGHGVLLLDEPTAALGPEQSRQVRQLITRLAGQGVAVVVVTHDLPLCFAVTHRVAVLHRGRKVADLPTAETDLDAVVGWITGARPHQP